MMVKMTMMCGVMVASLVAGAETLGNASLGFDFGEANEGFALRRIVNRLGGETVFAERTDAKSCLWVAQFWKNGDSCTTKGLNNLLPCRTRRLERNPDGGATFVWEGMDLPDDPGAVTVRMTVRFAADGTSRWAIDVQNQSRDWGLAETHYPIIPHVAKDGEADFLCPWSDVGARLYPRHRWGGKTVEFWNMAYPPMMTAWMKGRAGLYVAAHDSDSRIKRISISPESEVRFVTPVENAGVPGKAAEGPRYEVTVAAFKGDWWEASKLYRRWALTTKWTAKGRMIDRADYPKRFCEIPLWFNIHGSPNEVSNVMTRAKALFPNVRSGIHWHHWHHSAHDINYPEYFPEQPGTKECLVHLKSIGQEAMPYTNGRLWTCTTYGFDYARAWAMQNEHGDIYRERYGKYTPPFSPMCPFTKQWDDTLNRLGGEILGLGFRSLFLDQIGAVGGRICIAPEHGHPVGGGDWYFAGYQKILERLHRTYRAKDAFLTTEGSGEAWMNVIDGYLTVTQRHPDMVPFLHSVYNGYTTWFCSPENHEDDDDSFWAAQAREVMWGQCLGWYHPLILDLPNKVALVRKLVEFRRANVDCLSFGEMTGEVRFVGDVPRQKVKWLGRKEFFYWQIPNTPLSPTIEGELPGVMGYFWKSGATGRACAIIANLTPVEQPVEFAFGDRTVRLTLAPRELRRVE